MRKILIQTRTDRGKSTRISTVHNDMRLEIYYLDSVTKGIRRVQLALREDDSDLLVAGPDGHLLRLRGEPAAGLGYKDR